MLVRFADKTLNLCKSDPKDASAPGIKRDSYRRLLGGSHGLGGQRRLTLRDLLICSIPGHAQETRIVEFQRETRYNIRVLVRFANKPLKS